MSHFGTHRHCRAAKKQAEHCDGREVFMSNKQFRKMMCISACAVVIAYLKGIIVGYMMCKAHGSKGCMM